MARRMKGPVLSKEEKLLGVDTCREMEAMEISKLEEAIVQANASIREALEELEANENYRRVRDDLKHLKAGFNDLKRRQAGRIAYALKLREQKGA